MDAIRLASADPIKPAITVALSTIVPTLVAEEEEAEVEATEVEEAINRSLQPWK